MWTSDWIRCSSTNRRYTGLVQAWTLAFLLLVVHTGAQDQRQFVFHVREELPAWSPVGDLRGDSTVLSAVPEADLDIIDFSIVQRGGHEQYFTVIKNGTLYASSVIDRDSLCPMATDCTIAFDVQVTPVSYFHILKVQVVLSDINDNAPVFDQDEAHIAVSEASPRGTLIPLPRAVDLDSPDYGVANYSLEGILDGADSPSISDLFSLETRGEGPEHVELYLVLQQSLDYELHDQYLFTVVAVDSPTSRGPAHSAALLVNISVTDVNDNAPLFTRSEYIFLVPEDLTPGHRVGRVAAVDLDDVDQGNLRYELTPRGRQSDDEPESPFRVDNRTGDVYLTAALDYERTSQYLLEVTAWDRAVRDSGSVISLTSQAAVSIKVLDVNDNPPRVSLVASAGGASSMELAEGSAQGLTVAHVSVTDPDSGPAGIVHCSLDTEEFTLTQIYSSDYMIKTAGPLDHEEAPVVDMTLTCSDKGSPPLVTTLPLRVLVTDVNDNTPTFSRSRYDLSVSGDLRSGDLVTQVLATDADDDANGAVRYFIDGDLSNKLFAVDWVSGQITAKTTIPFYMLSHITLTVVAEDAGWPTLSQSVSVVFTPETTHSCQEAQKVVDDDDNKAMVLSLMENAPQGSVVGQISRLYAARPSCSPSFSLYPSTASFEVNSLGVLTSKEELDYETESCQILILITQYNCTVDTDPSSQAVTFQEIRIVVQDQNDNAPVVWFPTLYNNTVHVGSSYDKTRAVSRILATDPDTGDGGRLRFIIDNQDELPYLEMDPDTGELFLTDDYPVGPGRTVRVLVRITDLGDPPLASKALLRLVFNSTSTPGTAHIVGAESLVVVLATALPCGFLVVCLTVLLAVWLRRRARPRDTTKLDLITDSLKTSRESSPDLFGAKPQTPTEAPLEDGGGIYVICRELGVTIGKDACNSSLEKEDSGCDPGDVSIMKDLEICRDSLAGELARPRVVVLSPFHAPTHSRDSDSGCSTDMSHSTTAESWPPQPRPPHSALVSATGIHSRKPATNTHSSNKGNKRQYRVSFNCAHNVEIIEESPPESVDLEPKADDSETKGRQNASDTYIDQNKVMKYGHIKGASQTLTTAAIDDRTSDNINYRCDNKDPPPTPPRQESHQRTVANAQGSRPHDHKVVVQQAVDFTTPEPSSDDTCTLPRLYRDTSDNKDSEHSHPKTSSLRPPKPRKVIYEAQV